MPTGCGEQNMAKLAPNIYIMDYLTNTNQVTKEIRKDALKYMSTGTCEFFHKQHDTLQVTYFYAFAQTELIYEKNFTDFYVAIVFWNVFTSLLFHFLIPAPLRSVRYCESLYSIATFLHNSA